LNQFKKFIEINSINQLLRIPQSQLQYMLENYLISLKRSTNPNSIPSKFQGIKHFCIMNRINLNWNILYKMFPQKTKTQDLRSWTTQEIREMLSNTRNPRDQALIHFLTSTGARIGVFDHELSIEHMSKISNDCNAIKLYAGHVEEYWAFLTPQASKILNVYHDYRKIHGETFSKRTPIFAVRGSVPRQLGWSGARSVIYRTISKSNISRNKQDNRYDVQADHGFRKRFNTILKLDNSVNHNIAEKLMGHKNGLDGVYLTPTTDELFAEFEKTMHKIEV